MKSPKQETKSLFPTQISHTIKSLLIENLMEEIRVVVTEGQSLYLVISQNWSSIWNLQTDGLLIQITQEKTCEPISPHKM